MFWKMVLIILLALGIFNSIKTLIKKSEIKEKNAIEIIKMEDKKVILFTKIMAIIWFIVSSLILIWATIIVNTNIAIIGCILLIFYHLYCINKINTMLPDYVAKIKMGQRIFKKKSFEVINIILGLMLYIYVELMLLLSVL